MYNKDLLPGGSALTDEQEALLAMFMEKEDFVEEKQEEKPIVVRHPEDRYKPFPLTDIQLAYLIGRDNGMLGMSNVSSHIYCEFEVEALDPERYQEAWRKMISHHDLLHAVITGDGQQQVLESYPPFEVPLYDLSRMGQEERQRRIEELRGKYRQMIKPVDQWPGYDVFITKLAEDKWRIHMSLEGLFGDVYSLRTMIRESQLFYNQPDLEPEEYDITFRDYVLSLDARRSLDSYKQARKYWMDRIPTLSGGPALPVVKEEKIKSVPFVRPFEASIPEEAWTFLKNCGARRGLSPTSILIAVFSDVLRRWSMERDFCLNLTLFNRLPVHPQINEIIGDFTDTLLLESKASDGTTFEERAMALRDRLWNDLDNRQFSGMDVLREVNRYHSERTQQIMPVVFTSTFLMGDYAESVTGMALDGHALKQVYSSSQTPQLMIDHQVLEDHGSLRVHWDVRSEYFRPGYLEVLFETYINLIRRLAADEALWKEKNLVDLPEKQLAMRREYNSTGTVEGSLPLMHELFLEKALEHPWTTALVDRDGSLSYIEVLDLAAAAAAELKGQVKPDDLVAVIMEKGRGQVVAVLGTLFAGAAYLPIDPGMPKDRMRSILDDSGARFILTQKAVHPSLEWAAGQKIIDVDALVPADGRKAFAGKRSVQGERDLAYVIYTSGSTGTPKGVMIEHRAAVNTLLDVNRRFGIGPEDAVFALANLGFDLSVWDIFGTLAAGGRIVFPDPDLVKEPSHWAETVAREHVTCWNTVPAMMQMLVDHLGTRKTAEKGSLRVVMLSGDWIPLDLPERIRRHFDASIYSLGGATEASIWSIYFPIEKVEEDWESIPYGRPLGAQHFYVLNPETLEPCPDYVQGSLYIGGEGLARGYRSDPEKTAKAFFTHPRTGERLYSTGDNGYFTPGGCIVFAGRQDNQLKIHGFRVELGEIEHAILSHPDVREAVVVPVGDVREDRLAAYVTTAGKDSFHKATEADTPEARALWDSVKGIDQGVEGIREGAREGLRHMNEGPGSALYKASVQAVLTEMGVYVHEGDAYSVDEILRITGIRPRYARWLKRALASLEKAGFLVLEGDLYRRAKPFEFTGMDAVQEKFKGERLGPLLSEARHMRDLLQERMHSAEIYAQDKTKGLYSSVFKYSYQIIRDGLEAMARNHPLDILEVGGGHGGATKAILPALPRETRSFCFTDISRFFLQNAEASFKEANPFMSFKVLDLNEEPSSQKFKLHSYDAIVAASVLHDVKDVKKTLKYLLSLLKPNGVAFILEQTVFFEAHDLTMGLQQGFDAFEDTDLRRHNPLLSGEQWEQALYEAGYADVRLCRNVDAVEHNVILAKGPSTVWEFEPQKMAEYLSGLIPAYMIPPVFMELDAMPRNRSGKIDRKALPRADMGGAQARSVREPRTEVQRRLAAIWADMLRCETPSLDDSFFALGGDSLLATVLIAKVHETFHFDFSVRDIYALATLEDMAGRIENEGGGKKDILTLKQEGTGTPWFFVPGAEGDPMVFRQLVEHLDAPCHCMLLGEKPEQVGTVKDMAQHCIQEILAVRPEGPYRIAGYCMGGFVASEVANQLAERGASVEQTVILDSFQVPIAMRTPQMMLVMFLGGIGIPLQVFKVQNWNPLMDMLFAKYWETNEQRPELLGRLDYDELVKLEGEAMLKKVYSAVGSFMHGMTFGQFSQAFALFCAGVMAESDYKPAKGAKLQLFYASEGPSSLTDAEEPWRKGGCEYSFQKVAGDHVTMMLGESAAAVAGAMNRGCR